MSEPREVMNMHQMAEYLGISEDTVYRYAASGKIPAFRLGNRWRFKRSLVDAWMLAESREEMESHQPIEPPLGEEISGA